MPGVPHAPDSTKSRLFVRVPRRARQISRPQAVQRRFIKTVISLCPILNLLLTREDMQKAEYAHVFLFRCPGCHGALTSVCFKSESNLETADVHVFRPTCDCGWTGELAGLLLSAYAGKQLSEEVKRRGFQGFISKNDAAKTLLGAVDAIVHSKQSFYS